VADEWNFSVDPAATHWVLKEGKDLSVITRNVGISFSLSTTDFIHRLIRNRSSIGRYMVDRSTSWLEYTMLHQKSNGFYLWDLVAAAYLANPQFFEDQQQIISLSTKTIGKGLLRPTDNRQEGQTINLPTLRDSDAFVEDIYNTWLKVDCSFVKEIGGGW
jgi:purine nucleosidase